MQRASGRTWALVGMKTLEVTGLAKITKGCGGNKWRQGDNSHILLLRTETFSKSKQWIKHRLSAPSQSGYSQTGSTWWRGGTGCGCLQGQESENPTIDPVYQWGSQVLEGTELWRKPGDGKNDRAGPRQRNLERKESWKIQGKLALPWS